MGLEWGTKVPSSSIDSPSTIDLPGLRLSGGFQFGCPFEQIDETQFPDIGGKAVNLVRLKRAGLPVPPGYCITTEAHEYYLANGRLPEELITEIIDIKRVLGGKVAIRSSANCEDTTELSMAGVFESHYVYDDERVASIVEQIFRQSRSKEVTQFLAMYGRSPENVKMGLVIQQLIEPESAGVIYTGVNGGNLLIQYVDGFGVSLVDGQTHGSVILVDQSGTIRQSTGFESRPLSPDYIRQIQQHGQAIEDLFPGSPQDIEFASKDGSVYIVQARTLTTDLGTVELEEIPQDLLEATKRKLKKIAAREKEELGTKTAIFSDANYSELLPRPTEMDIGIYMSVWGGSDGIPGAKQIGHAEMGYLVGNEAIGVINYIGGRTYFSIGRMAALYHIGFPETKEEYFSTLVNEYLDTVQTDPEKGSYPQMGLYLQDPTLKDLQARFGYRGREYFQLYQTFTRRMRSLADMYIAEFYATRFPAMTTFVRGMREVDLIRMTKDQLFNYGMGILEHIRTYSFVDFVYTARLGFYYSQRLQDLLQRRLRLNKGQAQEMYSRLNQGLDGSLVTDANTKIADAGSEEEALSLARQLVGHFSTGEMLEIRHKPLRDDPEALLRYVRGIRQAGDYPEQLRRQKEARLVTQRSLLESVPSKDKEEFEAVMKASQTYMALRETIKYLFTTEYLLFRDALEILGNRLGLTEGDIYFLYPRELSGLVTDPGSLLHLIRSRRQSFVNYQKLDLPHVIRESDIDALNLVKENDEDFQRAQGKFLAGGSRVKGVVINLDEYKDLSQVEVVFRWYRTLNIPIILVATQMNLTHDPYIAQAAGLVIENAGIVAHGAQRARELGKGAIAGIRSKLLKTGIKVDFDPSNRVVRRVK